ncbi:MAG TPA: ABC transporter permease [Bryobacteraceae bacterium]|nr:ABC transporter permease [Bryobacteraceae bacterium]
MRKMVPQALRDLVQDTVFTARMIRQRRGFAAAAAVSAALGIGACSTIFTLANYALLRPLPVKDASRLVSVSGRNLRQGRAGRSMTYPDFADLRQARSFEGMTAFFSFLPATIASGGEPQRYWGSLVTADYFDVVRPAFAIGRGFDPQKDDRKGEAAVVVLSHRLWRSRFRGDPDILGRSIEVNGRKAKVVGVTGPGFRGTEALFFSDFWLPFSMFDLLQDAGMGGDRVHDRGSQWLMAAGRLHNGVSEAAAAAELEVIGERLRAAYPATNRDRGFHLERAGQMNPGLRKMIVAFFLLLLAVAGLVLFTACANVANLLLARASARQKEIATRLAIGAGRGRLIRQLLTESVMLALIGGIGGYAIAWLGASGIGRARLPIGMPVDLSVPLDHRVMLFSIALSAVTGVVFGLVPALRAARVDLVGGLKDQPVRLGQSRRFGLRNLLVVAQVTVCMVLLICSGLFLRSFSSARHLATGFAHRNLLLVGFDPSMNRYSKDETRRIVDAVLADARALPGVESASLSSGVPLDLEGTQNSFVPEGQGGDEKSRTSADIYAVSPGFFETLGIRRTEGEDFRPGVATEDVAIVNQALVHKAFRGQSPLGRRILYMGRVVQIIGVVETVKSRSIGEEPRPCLYFPMARDLRGNDSLTGMKLVLRTRGNPAGYTAAVHRMIRRIDPTLAIFDVRTMEEQLSRALFFPRAAALLFGLAGGMGLLIATVGLYGVISFTVAQQTKEIGIRMALGAMRWQVLRMVLQRGLVLTVIGAVAGLGLSAALARAAASLLYGISPTDGVTFVCVPALLLTIALAACLVPARRAAALDPMQALRYE